jgi:DNA repair protein SbcD/Mre11
MRMLHTADWHLGRSLHGMRLLDDQAYVLAQLTTIARDWQPDVVVIAGDVYDRTVPPGDAIELLDTTLSDLVMGLRIPVIIIAGNHDGPQWLSFGSRLLTAAGVHMFGSLRRETGCVTLHDTHGPVRFYAMPYADPAIGRDRLQNPAITDHSRLVQTWVTMALGEAAMPGRAVAVAHAFVSGGQESTSERQLTVGGTGQVPVAHFTPFHYTALGHLHAPQSAGGARVQYAGSLLKYSISEIDHVKSVTLVEMDAHGQCQVERVPLRPQRDLRRVAGMLDALLTAEPDATMREDYVVVSLLDTEPVVDPMNRLRRVYPQIIHLERPALPRLEPSLSAPAGSGQPVASLFAGFYRAVTGVDLADDQQALFTDVIDGPQHVVEEGHDAAA